MSLSNIKDMTPNQDLIESLERMLDQAKKGELRSMFAVRCYDNDGVNSMWQIDNRNTMRRIVGEIAIMQQEFITNINMGDKDSIIFKAVYPE